MSEITKVVTDISHYNAIAVALQEYNTQQSFAPSEMGKAVGDACRTAYHDGEGFGYTNGYRDGEVEGRQEQNAEFWDKYFEGVENAGRMYTFSGTSWNKNTFYPTQDIPLGTGTFFYFSYYYNAFSLTERLNECGVKLLATDNGAAVFQNAWFTEIPEVDFSQITSLAQTFSGARVLKTIEGLILKDAGINTFSNTFQNCTALENIKITGTIGNNISFANSSKLTSDSVDSIVGALKKLEKDEAAKTLTLHATVKTNMTPTQTATIQEKGWSLA